MGLIFCIGTLSRAISSFGMRTIRLCCWTLVRRVRLMGVRSRSVTSIITPGYAPIEQYSSRGDQGPWTDIYALGGVCYRALTGEVPDDATDRMRDDPLIPVIERCAGQASAEFLSAIDWALQVDEGDRPQSISEWRAKLEDDLTEAQEGEIGDEKFVRHDESQAHDETTVGQQDAPPSDLKKKTKGKLIAAVIGVVALIVVGVVGKIYVDQAEKQRQEQAFVAKVGRMPYPDGVNDEGETDLHLAAEQNRESVKISDFPQGDLPGNKEKEEYKSASVASYKFYYGIGRPIDYRKARYAAFVEFEQGSPILGGASVLMMLYANGFGVERDLDLSIKLARLEVWGAPAAIEGRIAHLEELKTKSEETPFDLCNDITRGFMMGVCTSIWAEKAEVAKKKDMRSLIESWSLEHLKAFITLMEYVDGFNGARYKREIETSGSAGGVKTMTEEEYLSKFLLSSFRAFEEGFFPQYTRADFIEADKELNQVYSELRLKSLTDEFPFSERPGFIQFEDVRGVQRLWIKYRDAWVQFGSVKYPQVSPDSWKTWLTNERIKQLNSLGGTPGINPFLDSGKDIDDIIQEGLKSFKKY